MRRHRIERIPEYLQDILRSIAQIQKYAAGVTKTDFENNDMLYDAVLLNLHIVGEASHRILEADPNFVELYPNIDLKDAYSMRNRVAHGYDEISLDIVWSTLTISLPRLKSAIDQYLNG